MNRINETAATIDDDASLGRILSEAGPIALVGASQKPWRDSNSIMAYLLRAGYRVVPVNPNYDEVLGVKCHPGLSTIPGKISIVNIFRNPQEVLPIIEEAVAVGAGAVWLQTGVINNEAALRASAAGIPVVMDRCIAVEHRRLFHAK